MDNEKLITAFLLTLLAGLSTGIGGIIAVLAKRTNKKFLCASLGFSAGVMIYVSFMEMLPQAKDILNSVFEPKSATLYMLLALFGGMAFIAAIDFMIPKSSNPHEMLGPEDAENKKLQRTGIVVAITIAIHNFPEGIATFTSALSSLDIAIPITIAIAIHNIPEGIVVAMPIYHSTGSKKKALLHSFLSGLAEPLGALAAYLFLMQFWSPLLNGIILAAVSGIMIFISFDELLPSAEKYGEHHISVSGLVLGMIVMAVSLYLFV